MVQMANMFQFTDLDSVRSSIEDEIRVAAERTAEAGISTPEDASEHLGLYVSAECYRRFTEGDEFAILTLANRIVQRLVRQRFDVVFEGGTEMVNAEDDKTIGLSIQ